LEKDVVISKKFQEWKRNLAQSDKGMQQSIQKQIVEPPAKTEPKPHHAFILKALEQSIPESTSSKTQLHLPLTIGLTQSNPQDYMVKANHNVVLPYSSSTETSLVQTTNNFERPRSPRKNHTMIVAPAANPIKIFLPPQAAPIILRRSEPQPTINSPLFSSGLETWNATNATYNQNHQSSLGHLREETFKILPISVNSHQTEPKKKTLLDLPSHLVQPALHQKGAMISATQQLKNLQEPYRPLLSRDIKPSQRSVTESSRDLWLLHPATVNQPHQSSEIWKAQQGEDSRASSPVIHERVEHRPNHQQYMGASSPMQQKNEGHQLWSVSPPNEYHELQQANRGSVTQQSSIPVSRGGEFVGPLSGHANHHLIQMMEQQPPTHTLLLSAGNQGVSNSPPAYQNTRVHHTPSDSCSSLTGIQSHLRRYTFSNCTTLDGSTAGGVRRSEVEATKVFTYARDIRSVEPAFRRPSESTWGASNVNSNRQGSASPSVLRNPLKVMPRF
jgi:hypothetical protein